MTESAILPEKKQKHLVKQLEGFLLALNKIAVRRLLLESGLPPLDFMELVVAPALEAIGASWEKGNVALAQVYMSGRICESLIEDIITVESGASCPHPPMAIAVLCDSHMLGKRMVCSVLRASGYHIFDYGQMETGELVARVAEDGVKILLVSTLMLPSALRVKELRERMDALGLEVKLIVGGPSFRFDPNLWREVGADATSPTASGVVAVVKDLIGGTR